MILMLDRSSAKQPTRWSKSLFFRVYLSYVHVVRLRISRGFSSIAEWLAAWFEIPPISARPAVAPVRGSHGKKLDFPGSSGNLPTTRLKLTGSRVRRLLD
jgi:hypothetical protein